VGAEAEGLDAARGRQTGKSLALNVNIPEASDPADPDIPRGTGIREWTRARERQKRPNSFFFKKSTAPVLSAFSTN